jgi:hypothetical protein
MKFYRQGDVGLQKVDFLPKNVAEVSLGERIVLAYGEATGHAHAIERPAGKARLWDAGAERFLQVIAPVALRHEEHAPITLEVGIYKIVQQREYTPAENRRVRD